MKEIRYEKNPFLSEMVVKTKNKRVTVSNSAKINDDIWINQSGQTLTTQVTTYREVDDAQFIKLFTQNLALSFNLTAAGIKALHVLMYALQHKGIMKDIVLIDDLTHREFSEKNDLALSRPTLLRGLAELVNSQIIARYKTKGMFFINPNFVFNGDRVVFVNAIKRKSKTNNDEFEQLELEI